MMRLLASLTFAAVLTPGFATPAPAQDGKVAFDKACARCHTTAKVTSWMKKHPDTGKRKAWLDGKLARHHAHDATLRADIIAYLETAFAAAK